MSIRPRSTLRPTSPDAWPPSPSRLPPSLDDDNTSVDDDDTDAALFQENPLTYFLTPATPKDDEVEFDFEFDAGIEDVNQPREIVRSVSPSTLDGLKKYKPKSKQPDYTTSRHRDQAEDDDDDDDDDDEDYIRFSPNEPLPFGFENFFDRPHQSARLMSSSVDSYLSPANFHVGSPGGRPHKRFAPPRRSLRSRGRTLQQLQRRHSWREPSPDVWSIDEEPEKETMSEMGFSTEDLTEDGKTMPIDIPDNKPKKRVRFVLPIKE